MHQVSSRVAFCGGYHRIVKFFSFFFLKKRSRQLLTFMQKTKKSGKQAKKVVLDFAPANAEAEIVKVNDFAKYLKEHIKVEGRTGELEDKITVATSGNKITITSYIPFSGKYAKYLTKRYLKKNELRDWLRVVASARSYYEVRFYNLAADEDEEEEEEEEEDEE